MAPKSMRDKIRERAQNRPTSGGGFSTLSLPDGAEFLSITADTKGGKEATVLLDFFPYLVGVGNHPMAKDGEEWWERTYFVHRDIGVDEKPYICPKTFGKRCPICDRRKVLMENWDENKDIIKALRPSERQLFNVIDQADNKVYVLDIAYPCFGELLEKELRSGKEEWSDFPNVEGGYTLKIRFDEKKIGKNPFWDAGRIDFEPRGDYDKDIYDYGVDLDSVLIPIEGAELERIYLELDDEPPAPEEGDPGHAGEEADSAPTKPKPPTRKAPAKPKAEEEPAKKAPVKPAGRGGRSTPAATRERPKRPDAEAEAEPKAGDDPVCPAGGTFGEADSLDGCYECPTGIWDACKDRKDGIS